MMTEFYENLLKATDNTKDITNEKYGTITKLGENNICSVIETDTNLEHSNVPILNGLKINTGDDVVIGFVDNSIYNPIIIGKVGKAEIDTEQVREQSALSNLGLPANSNQHQINLKVNEKINQGGGSGGIVMVGSFQIDSNGHLIATIPNGADNPYYIDFSTGHLIYDTANAHNGGLITNG